MRIVYLADGPYVHTRRWVEHFARSGVECEVISFRPAEIEGARVHYVDGAEPLGKARYLLHARRVKGLIRELRPDIVHALHLTSYGFLGALAGIRPLIISVWGTDVLEAPRLTPFHSWLTRHSLARADLITATGLHLATETTLYAPRGKPVTVVPYGVDMTQFAPSERPTKDEVVIGAVSRLSVEKGLRYLIDAFATLRERYGTRVRLRIAGEGPERERLEAQTQRLGLGDAVEMTGWVEHEALPRFLQAIDIFALPSTYEGFGVAAVEASAMALPVVGTNVYGIPDVVRNGVTGLLTAAKDAPSLAQAIGRLIDDPALRLSMGKAGREYVAQQYDWHDNLMQMERIYETLAHRAVAA